MFPFNESILSMIYLKNKGKYYYRNAKKLFYILKDNFVNVDTEKSKSVTEKINCNKTNRCE